jgi:hypothetical protein
MNHEERMVKFLAGDGPFRSLKMDRNGLCQCGSGKKQKKCCGTETRWYHTKPKKEEIKYPEDLLPLS